MSDQQFYNEIRNYADSLQEELIDFRRDLHQYPELGWLEIRTTYQIYKELSKLDCEVIFGEEVTEDKAKMGLPKQKELTDAYEFAIKEGVPKDFADQVKNGNTGLVAIFKNGEGPTVGMRFDIDALPMIEDQSDEHYPTQEGFASKRPGVMHACGHDGHSTIGLGVAKTIDRFKDHFKGTIKIIFQPAEEGVRGAKSIVEKGHLDDVDYFFASHITDDKKYPDCDLFPGSGGALATSKLDVEFFGKSSHAAGAPENGQNAMLGLATTIMNLHSIPRHSKGTTRINVGVAESGSGRNIISDYARLMVETRGIDTETNEYIRNYAENIVEGAAKMHTLEYKISKAGEAPSLESDQQLMEIIRETAEDLNLKATPIDKMPLGGSEDVSYMMTKVQEKGGIASFMRILTPLSALAHDVSFDFDEQILPKAVSVFTGSAYKVMTN